MKWLRRVAGIAASCIGIGMIIVIVAYAVGGPRVLKTSADNHYSMEEEITEEVNSLDISVAAGKVKVVEGDGFYVSVSQMEEDGFISEVRNGTLYVYNTDADKYLADFFGFKVPIMYGVAGIGYNEDVMPEVIVTVPVGVELENFKLDVAAGGVNIRDVQVKYADFSISNGSLRGDGIIVSEQANVELGAGEVRITDFIGEETNLSSGMGSMYIEGVINGNTYADAGIGQIYLNLDGEETDYNFNADCGIGAVTINNRSYGGLGRSYYKRNGDGPYFELECGIGQVKVSIR